MHEAEKKFKANNINIKKFLKQEINKNNSNLELV